MSMSSMPVPQGRYVAATRYRDVVYTSGMTPRLNGRLISEGRVRKSQEPESCRQAVMLACSNALAAAEGTLGNAERLDRAISLTVFIAAAEEFKDHSKIADFASDHLFAELGEAGIGSRAAIGVHTLPGDAPVEIQLVLSIVDR